MNKVKVLGIIGCNSCDKLKAELYERDIEFSFIDVDQNEAIAIEIENLLDTGNYPILVLEHSNRVDYFYFADDSSELGHKKLNESVSKHGVYDRSEIIEKVSKIVKGK